MSGGDGHLTLAGGVGNDVYRITNDANIIEAAGEGQDTVEINFYHYSYYDNVYVMADNVETMNIFDMREQFYDYNTQTVVYSYQSSVVTGTALANLIAGGEGSNEIHGAGGVDTILGGTGDDLLDGGAGKDVFDGGDGRDMVLCTSNTTPVRVDLAAAQASFPGQGWATERFASIENAATGSGADTLAGGDGAAAFEGAGAALGDRIDVSAIDADATLAGNQTFVRGGTGRGHVWAVNSAGITVIRGNTDGDAAIEFELAIADGAVAAASYAAADFIL
ncbi:MAG: hypothetical protein QM699_09300 [Amaricoccus sp.]|uniref:calcium-binding protein n=1 Tax=Amaricoccus sp. TaxID=1872485 RepID=UPI0039E4DEF6